MILRIKLISTAALVLAIYGTVTFATADGEAATIAAQNDELDADLKLMQGRWQMKPNPNLKMEWEIDGNKNIMTVYQGDNVVHKQSTTFKLKKDGPVKVSEWEKGDILAGPRKGQRFDGGRLIYRIDHNRIINVLGMLDADNLPMNVEVMERVPAN